MAVTATAATTEKPQPSPMPARDLVRRAVDDLKLPAAIAAALLAVLVASDLLVPGGLKAPITAAAGTAVILLAFLRWPKTTLVVFALFALTYDSIAHWLNSGVHSIDELVIPGMFLIAGWREKPWRKGVFEPIRDGAVIIVALLGIAASVVNAVPLSIWLVSLLLMLKSIAFLQVVLWHDWSVEDVRKAATTVFVVALGILAIGFVEAVVGPHLRDLMDLPRLSDVRGQLPGISSILYYAVVFSWFTAFVALFLLAYYLVYRRWWLLILAFFFGIATFLAGRRQAIAGLAMALFGGAVAQLRLGVDRRTMLRVWLPIGGVALALGIIFAPGLITLAEQTITDYGAPLPTLIAPDQSHQPGHIQWVNGNPRLLLYATSLDIAHDYFPLGAGLGRYGTPLSRLDFSPIYAKYDLDRIWGLTPEYASYITDTFWPHILGEMGWGALIAYIAFIGALGVGVWRATRTVIGPFAHAFALGAFMIYIHAAVESLASSMYESPPRVYLAFGAIAIALALARAAKAAAPTAAVPEPAAAGPA